MGKNWENNRFYIKSTIDLKLLPEQVIYVEGYYDEEVNKYINSNYNGLSARLKKSKITDFIYLPTITKQLFDSQSLLSYFLKYYFPDANPNEEDEDRVSPVLKTDSISRLLFSSLEYNEAITSGFFRYVGIENDDLLVYEYFRFDLSDKQLIADQIDFYIDAYAGESKSTPKASEKGTRFFDDRFSDEDEGLSWWGDNTFIKDIFGPEDNDSKKDSILGKSASETHHKPKKTKGFFSRFESLSKSLFEEEKEDEEQLMSCENSALFPPEQLFGKREFQKEYELISQIKENIQNLKELGFYDLLIKEIGNILLEKKSFEMFEPSLLVMNRDFKIYLPDFKNMEIEMTPLPKSLFILFLRHPEGINLKSLIDYKKELLEIYKLLSYRETYFNMVESIDRICNPFEGSINEKLSRVKEAFLKKMSMDTAKHYIIEGERGMKKRISIDRSLVLLPKAFEEIELTKVSG